MLAEKFVTHALELVPRVVMLARLAFLESERRSAILDGGKLARVHVFKQRLPFMHRDNWQRAARELGDLFRVVLLGLQPRRPGHDRSNLGTTEIPAQPDRGAS